MSGLQSWFALQHILLQRNFLMAVSKGLAVLALMYYFPLIECLLEVFGFYLGRHQCAIPAFNGKGEMS